MWRNRASESTAPTRSLGNLYGHLSITDEEKGAGIAVGAEKAESDEEKLAK